MSFGVDVLVTALQELLPGFSETFSKYHPAFDHVIMRGNRRKAQGPWVQFALVPSGPGQVTTIKTGDEVIAGGRRENSYRATEYATTMIYAYDVPCQDLREANNEYDLAEILKNYPENGMREFREWLARQLVMGGVAGVSDFITLNGDSSYDPKGLGAQSGIFEFAAPASQTGTVWGQAKGVTKGLYNQYRHITSFHSNGRKRLYQAYSDASQEMAETEGDVDVILADRGTYDNYIYDLDDQVQIVEKSTKGGDRAPSGLRDGIKFRNGTMYADQYIEPSDFDTAAATQGVAYGLHSASWNIFTMGGSMKGAEATQGWFDSRGPERITTQDAYRFEYVLSMGMYCKQLRCNFACTGGNNA